MADRPARLRLAITPAGPLSVNAARVALASALLARSHGGHLTLRLDDRDATRCRPAFAEAILRDLDWIGVRCDAVIRQSDRAAAHARAADRLRACGRLYPCFESEAELRAKADRRRRRGQPDIYDRAMLSLTPAQRAAAEAGGKRPYWRFRLSDGVLAWDDGILGPRRVRLTAVSDPVLVAADGTVAPALASAVDDLDCGITDLVRGLENDADTAVWLDLLAALGAGAPPRIASLPPVRADRGGRKAGSWLVRALRDDGVLAPALTAWLTGGAGQFDPGRLRDPPAPERLLAANRAALAGTDLDAVADRLPAGVTETFWQAIRGEVDLLREAAEWWHILTGEAPLPALPEARAMLREALATLPDEPWDGGTWSVWTARLSEPVLRRALTGQAEGPPLGPLLPVIGRQRAAERLRRAIAAG